MKRLGPFAAFCCLVLLLHCEQSLQHGPRPCAPIAPLVKDPDLAGAVWGFADLHAHPAIERAFGGRFVWGTAVDEAPVDASELPLIESCPVETHDRNASSPIDHAVGTLVYPRVAGISYFAHAPVGAASTTAAWPNARDVIHQQMNVASIRRAYEGGLRLMFASTTDNQVIAQLLEGPNFVNGFVPDAAFDFRSAKAQIELIQEIVEQNSNWMWVARTPSEARDIINGGRLAVVLSLEMDGLREEDTRTLISDWGVRHVLPVHLVDNDVGGTAINSDLFNAASAEVSEIYRDDHEPMKYLDITPSTAFSPGVHWPQQIVTGPSAPLYVDIQNIPWSWYQQLCYEPLDVCSGTTPQRTHFILFGQQNLRGLCASASDCQKTPHPGIARVAGIMDNEKGVFVDVSHMSDKAVGDTVGAAPTKRRAPPAGYPLIASHGDVAHLCDLNLSDPACLDRYPALVTERSLRSEYARQIADRGGVIGLGTGTGSYATRTVLAARGGPLLTVSPGVPAACVAIPGPDGSATAGCVPAPVPDVADTSAPVDHLEVQVLGGVLGKGPNVYPFVRVELAGPDPDRFQHHVIVQPLECSTGGCRGSVDLDKQDKPTNPTHACASLTCDQQGTCADDSYTVDQILRITLETLYLGCDLACQKDSKTTGQDLRCSTSSNVASAPEWTIDQADVFAGSAATPLVHVGGGQSAPPVARLGGSRGSITLYDRSDRPSASPGTPATGNLLRVWITSGTEQPLLQGAGAAEKGANVCIAVRRANGSLCPPTAPIAANATECPAADGWVSINQRGTWAQGAQLYTFVRFAGEESEICGVDVSVLDWEPVNPSWTIDEVRVESAEDPIGHFVQRYAEISQTDGRGRMGVVAFGTDANGLNGMTDISEFAVPAGTTTASLCPAEGYVAPDGATGKPLPLAPMRLRNGDGSLGREVLIEDRGLATYGMLADMVGIIQKYPGCGEDVRDSLMLSAEATIRAWEAILDPTSSPKPLPPAPNAFRCAPAPWRGP